MKGFGAFWKGFFRLPYEYELEGGCAYQCGKDLVAVGAWKENLMPYVPNSLCRINQTKKKP